MTAPGEVPFVTTRATDLPAALEGVPSELLTASISPYAQAEVCAAALTLRLGASFCHSPRELPVTPGAVGDDFSKLEGRAAFSVVVIMAPPIG